MNKNAILTLCCGGLSFVALVLYVIFEIDAKAFNWIIFLLLTISVGANVLGFVKKCDWVQILSSASCVTGLVLFIMDSIGSLSDFFNGIVMFGDPSQAPMIFVICAFILTATILSVVVSFLPLKVAKNK